MPYNKTDLKKMTEDELVNIALKLYAQVEPLVLVDIATPRDAGSLAVYVPYLQEMKKDELVDIVHQLWKQLEFSFFGWDKNVQKKCRCSLVLDFFVCWVLKIWILDFFCRKNEEIWWDVRWYLKTSITEIILQKKATNLIRYKRTNHNNKERVWE